jgi:hypothetical protein
VLPRKVAALFKIVCAQEASVIGSMQINQMKTAVY